MKKRLLSFLLLVAMVVTALPLIVLPVSASGSATEPSFTEEDYNALYVQDNLVYALDFFTLNEYWADARGEHPAFPVGPADNTAYWYDANNNGTQDEGEILDLTQDANRYNGKYVVVEMPNNYTYNQVKVGDAVKTYDTYAEALEAARAMVGAAADAEPPFKTNGTAYPHYLPAHADISDAYKAAAKQWSADEVAWVASYTWKTTGSAKTYSVVTHSDSNAAKRVVGAPKEHSVFTVEDGYLNFRSAYNAGMNGGILTRNLPDNTKVSTVQVGATLLDPMSLSSRVPFIFYNYRVELVKANNSATEYTIKGLPSNSGFQLASGDTFPTGLTLPMGENFTFTQVQTVGDQVGTKLYDATLALYTQNSQVFSLTGTYNAAGLQSSQFYIGWSNVLKAKMYSFRQYADALTMDEVAQNHFADIAKWFKLDLSPLALLSGDELKPVYAAVKDFTFDSDRDEVAAAVLAAAQSAATAKYSTIDADIVAVAVQYGLDISPLMVQPAGLMANTIAFLREGYKTAADVKAGYEAALNADLASTMTPEQYNELYVKDAIVAIDYFLSNQYWYGADAPTSAIDPSYIYVWKPTTSNLYLKADSGVVADGFMRIPGNAYTNLGYNNYSTNNGLNGATAEYVVANAKNVNGQLLNLDDIRVNGTASGSTFKITAIGQRDAFVGVLARPGEDNLPVPLRDTTLATFTMGGAQTYTLSYLRPAQTQTYYEYYYDQHGDPVKPDAGQASTSCFYVTHDLVNGEPVKRMNKDGKENPTAYTFAFHLPVYHEHTDGKTYIVGFAYRYLDNGIGHGADAVSSTQAGTQNFYHDVQGNISLRVDGTTLFSYDDVVFPNNSKINGGTYFRHTYGSERDVYAYRYYGRQLTDAEVAQNHFADVAKFFRLNLVGFDTLDAEGRAAIYAAVADISLSDSTRNEAQNAVSAVLNAAVDKVYDDMKVGVSDPDVLALIDDAKAYRMDISAVLAAKRDMSSVFEVSFDGLSADAAQALLDEAYLDAYYYISYMVDGEDDWNAMMQWCAANPYMAGKARVNLEKLMSLPFGERVGILDKTAELQAAASVADAQAIVDAYVAEAMAKYGSGYVDFNYNALYVTRGLLLAADYFSTNEYWGGTMVAPINPSENTAYDYNGTIVDLTKDENRYNGKWTINYMENSWTRQRLDAAGKPMDKSSKEHGQVFDSYEAAQLAAYNLANGTSLTELPAGQDSLIPTAAAVAAGKSYPAYEIAYDDLSDAFKAAYGTWKKEDRATLKEYVWFNINENDLLFFSYDKAGDSRAYVRAMGAPVTVSAFRPGEGYITIREDLHSDAGLQTNANLTKYLTSEATTQVIGTLNNDLLHNSSAAGSAMSIFYNVRPMVKKSAGGDGMVLQAISNFTASTALPKSAISLDGVKDMTYTLSGIGTADADRFSLRFGEEAWIDVEGTYAAWNGTTYLGYGQTFGGTKVYALRYYNVNLTNAEIAQNHFADLAKYFRIDLTSFAALKEAQLTALYAAVADMTFENTTREAVQAAYDAALASAIAGVELVEDAATNEAFLALAAAGKLDLAVIENIDADSREAIVEDLLAMFDPNYALTGRVIYYYYNAATYNFSLLTFAGYQVRLESGSQFANYAGVRAVYDIDLARVEEVCKTGKKVGFTVNVTVAGEARATLSIVYTWDEEAGALTYTGVNSATGEAVSIVERDVNGTKVASFYYTVTFKGEDFTKELLTDEFGYAYAIAIGEDLEAAPATYDFSVTSQTFGDTVTAAEVYSYFYANGYESDAVVASVFAAVAE